VVFLHFNVSYTIVVVVGFKEYLIAMSSTEELTSRRKYSLNTEPVVCCVINIHDF
jgi:hypothetical protein